MSGSAGAQHEVVPYRGLITVCAMGATLMQALDSTIANVALPYMQGSLSASYDQITWVLTSYIVAAAIMTAPVGWLSARFGQKNLYLVSIIGFTVASMLCGIATSLYEMVLFRLIQGVFGAALVPLSQGTMLNIYPPERRGSAMAIWGVGVMIGPILGPTLGGYLTDCIIGGTCSSSICRSASRRRWACGTRCRLRSSRADCSSTGSDLLRWRSVSADCS